MSIVGHYFTDVSDAQSEMTTSCFPCPSSALGDQDGRLWTCAASSMAFSPSTRRGAIGI